MSASDREHECGRRPHASNTARSANELSIAILSLAFAGCFLPQRDADEQQPGVQADDYFGPDGGGHAATDADGTCATPGASSVRVRVRTTAFGGKYAPRNVGAIWIEDGNGKFVRTLEVWANVRRRYLSRWRTSSADNTVDAVTGATLSSHTTHDRTWVLDAAERCAHPAGNYRVVVEHTDFNGAGPLLQIPFTMGAPTTVAPVDQATFHDVLVETH